MKLRPDQLDKHLAQSLAPIYLVGGDEPLQVQEACDAIRSQAREHAYSEREVRHVERGFDWQEVLQLTDSLSLFGERKIVELGMPTSKPGDEGARVLRSYAERPADDTLLLVICGKLDSATLRTKWAQALETTGVVVQAWPLDGGRLFDWVQARMRQQELQASKEAVSLLVERVEGNLLAAAQEIDKLLLLNGPGRVDVEMVAQAVSDSSRYNIYKLVDTALSGNADKTIKIINGLRGEGVEPVLLLWALGREIRSLSEMSAEVRRGTAIEAVLGQKRVWERRKPLLRNALKRHGLGRWYGYLQHCARIDRIIKGAEVGKPWDELLQLGLSLTGKAVLVAK